MASCYETSYFPLFSTTLFSLHINSLWTEMTEVKGEVCEITKFRYDAVYSRNSPQSSIARLNAMKMWSVSPIFNIDILTCR